MLTTILTHSIAGIVGLLVGAWFHYKFGAKVATDAQVIKDMTKKL